MGIINMYIQFDTNTLAPIFHLKPKPLSIDSFGGPGVFPQIIDFFKSKTTGEILIGLSLIPYLLINYIFSLYGILLLIRKKEYFVVLFILIILYFSALTGVVGLVRYKLPLMPIINILCAVGLINFYNKITGELSCIKKIKKRIWSR